MERKTKKIKLFGRDLLLSNRNTGDVVAFIAEAKRLNSDKLTYTDILLNSIAILEDGLKINIDNLKWYNFIKKYIYPKILSNSYLLNNLTPVDVIEYSGYVCELDGMILEPESKLDDKKKV